jgi:hypothetical protein
MVPKNSGRRREEDLPIGIKILIAIIAIERAIMLSVGLAER